MESCSSSCNGFRSSEAVSKRKHIDDVQPASLDEHIRLLQEDPSIVDSTFVKVSLDDLPDWFDERLFKKGQDFQANNLLAFGLVYFTGLISILATPGTANVLQFTKKSSTPCLALKRYSETFILIRMLSTVDIYKANLRWFKGINVIRAKHVTASKKHVKGGFHGIYQRDMAITQFGFMGYAFTVPENVGLAHCTHEDLEGLNHFWRVIGYFLGISDRLNICRKTVEETIELCRKISKEIVVECLENPLPGFNGMVQTVVDGLWYADFSLNQDTLLALTYKFAGTKCPVTLSWNAYINMKMREWLLYMCGVPYIGIVIRTYNNYLLNILYLCMEYCPVVAWMKFGKENVQLAHY